MPALLIRSRNCSVLEIASPLTATTMSPGLMPALAAAPVTFWTTTPLLTSERRCSSGVSGRTATPRRPLPASVASLLASCSSPNLPTSTSNGRVSPLRHTCSFARSPGFMDETIAGSSFEEAISFPLIERITSPGSRPAFAAGLSFSTDPTNAPAGFLRPKESASD
ncbi:MAG: hypothetical protein AW07_04200 [Candidatus Accumulibacter sp. SK-11]|nr:MAG: hypothetical protein AW07_04200 [Candidatus Accumulibacter sp. SK-11]